MAIADGYRTHDEGLQKKYRMPDLLNEIEMKMYFASTYGVGIEIRKLTEEEIKSTQGVGIMPVVPVVSERDREFAMLREQLGIVDLEKQLGVTPEGRAKDLDSHTMTKDDFFDKYGKQEANPLTGVPDSEGLPIVKDEETEEERKQREEKEQEKQDPPKKQDQTKPPVTVSNPTSTSSSKKS